MGWAGVVGTASSASATVVTTGGSVALASTGAAGTTGATVTIPAGSLGTATVITIADSGAKSPDGTPIFQFGPDGTTFDQPVQVTLPLPSGMTDGVIYWTQPGSTTEFQPLVPSITDTTIQGVIAFTTHFSSGYVGPRPSSTGVVTMASLGVAPGLASLTVGATQQLTATALYTDGTSADVTAKVTWTSSDPTIAAVSSGGLVTVLRSGMTMVTATDAASQSWNATIVIAGTTDTAVAPEGPPTLASVQPSPQVPVAVKGSTLQLSAIGSYSDGSTKDLTETMDWLIVGPEGIATVSNTPGTKGQFTIDPSTIGGDILVQFKDAATGQGPAPISVRMVDTAYAAMPLSLTATPGSVTPSCAQLRLFDVRAPGSGAEQGATVQLSAVATYADGTVEDVTARVAWAMTGTGQGTVSDTNGSKGRFTMAADATGDAIVQATEPWCGSASTAVVRLSPASVANLAVTSATTTVARGARLALAAMATFTDGTRRDATDAVGWTSSDPAVATVGNTQGDRGLVIGVAPGTTTITATDPGTGRRASVVVTGTAEALQYLVVKTADGKPATSPGGFTKQLVAIGTFTDGTVQDLTTRVTWTSSKPAVATVSDAPGSKGFVTAISSGSLQYQDSSTMTVAEPVSGKTGSLDVTVTPGVFRDLTLVAASASVFRSGTVQVRAIGSYSDGSTQDVTEAATWASSSPAVADLLAVATWWGGSTPQKGIIAAKAAGSTTITGSFQGASKSLALTVTVDTSKVKQVAITGYGAMALKEDGSVWTWGANDSGSLGTGFWPAEYAYPVPWYVNGLPAIAKIAGGDAHAVALAVDGSVWTWGNNYYGQLGTGDNAYRNAPVKVSGLPAVVDVAAGGSHTLAVAQDGTVWAWGHNDAGELGDGTRVSRTAPVQVTGLTGAVAVAAGTGFEQFSVALRSDGTVWTWGSNGSGQLGDGTATPLWNDDPALDRSSATPIPALVRDVKQVSAGGGHVLALRGDGTVWAWGSNSCGQTGFWVTGWCGNHRQPVPGPVPGLGGIARVAAGEGFSAVVLSTGGTVWTWGFNGGGLGRGATDWPSYDMHQTPMIVPGVDGVPPLSGVVDISAGRGVVTLKADGTVWSWGHNERGQIGNGVSGGVATIPTQSVTF